jgi:hypothetical protein
MPFYLFIRIPKFDIQVVLLTLYSTLELNNVLNVSFKSETLSLPITNIRCSLFLTITLENMPLKSKSSIESISAGVLLILDI